MRSLSTRAAGLLILILGIWGGLVPFVGPYFHFSLGPNDSWTWTSGRFWLSVLPGIVAVIDGLMKSRLTSLYSILDSENACYRFVVGFRDESVQKDLFDRWHQIADHHKGQKNLCSALKAAGFARCPSGWNANGTARGGPAKPGRSRHEHAAAADIKVKFPPSYTQKTGKFRAAAHRAVLCGPPASDPVHVEMPYKTKGQKKATCHFG